MEEKLEQIIKNQEILCQNQHKIYSILCKIAKQLKVSDMKQFETNLIVDIAGTVMVSSIGY